MTKGTFQSSSDTLEPSQKQTRPRDAQMGDKGTYQQGESDSVSLGGGQIDAPFQTMPDKGQYQMGGADDVSLSHTGGTWPFSKQDSSGKSGGK